MKDEDIRKILGQTPFFQNLSDDMLTTLASAGRTRNIKKGQSLFSVGDSGDAVLTLEDANASEQARLARRGGQLSGWWEMFLCRSTRPRQEQMWHRRQT